MQYDIKGRDESSCIDVCLKRRLTVVGDDSATGKTFLVNKIESFQRRFHIWSDIKTVSTPVEFDEINRSVCKVVIIDKMEQYLHMTPGEDNVITKCLQENPDKTFLIFSRSALYIPYSLFDLATIQTYVQDQILHFTLHYYAGG